MRLIGTLETLDEARLFSANLHLRKIAHSLEKQDVWIHNEDQLAEAIALFKRFKENPTNSEFLMPFTIGDKGEAVGDDEKEECVLNHSAEVSELLVPRTSGHFTMFLIALCSLIYFFSVFQEMSLLDKGIPRTAFISTPTQALLFFDLPKENEELDEMVQAAPSQHQEGKIPSLSPEILKQMQMVEKTPSWRGLCEFTLLKFKGEDTSLATGKMFSKICQGEFWRLITPIFLHGSLLHLLFNMMWLWTLGRQIEQRVGIFRYFLLTVFIGVFANLLQYLMSGPFFLGYSGVVLGLAGFIWSRERIAPWEGYPLQKRMIQFLGLFVLAMCLLQSIALFLFAFSLNSFDPNIANTAHIAGALSGAFLGQLSFFSARSPS